MANKFIGSSGTSRLWQRLQDSLVSLNTKLGQKANRSEIPAPYDDRELKAALNLKQDAISDLATIRDGAAKGATALQEVPNDIYSYDETDTGKIWVDGKKIYRTCVNVGDLPNNGRLSKRVTLSDIYGMVVSINGIAFDSTYMYPLPLVSRSAPILVYCTIVNATSFNIIIDTTSDRSSLAGYVIVEYTR